MGKELGRISAAGLAVVLFILLPAGAFAQGDQAQKVDLNSATFTELNSLPGIGPVTAERILEFRRENGPFKRVEDLMNVRGIGEKKFLRIKDLIIAGRPARKETEDSAQDR